MSAIVVGAAVIGGAATYAASENAKSGAKDAANISAASAQNATQLQGTIYDQNRADQAPWRTAGSQSLSKLQQMLGIGYGSEIEKPKYGINDLVDRSSDAWQPNADLYKTNADYKNKWDSFIANHLAAYGKMPSDSAGSILSNNVLGDVSGIISEQQAKRDAEAAPLKAAAQADPSYGSLLHNFGMEDYEADPGYAFRMQQGQQALERSAAARGGLYSGRAAKDLTAYSQGQASQEYQNAYNRYQSNQTNQFNRLATVAGIGQTANNALAQSGQNYANQVSNIGMTNASNQGNAALAAANASASGYTGLAKSLGGVNWGSVANGFSSPISTGYGGGYDPNTGLGNTSVNYGY